MKQIYYWINSSPAGILGKNFVMWKALDGEIFWNKIGKIKSLGQENPWILDLDLEIFHHPWAGICSQSSGGTRPKYLEYLEYLGKFGNVWKYLEIFGIFGNIWNIWEYLGMFGNVWKYLGIFGIFGNIWNILEYLEMFGNIWKYLGMFGNIWSIPNIWNIPHIPNNIPHIPNNIPNIPRGGLEQLEDGGSCPCPWNQVDKIFKSVRYLKV